MLEAVSSASPLEKRKYFIQVPIMQSLQSCDGHCMHVVHFLSFKKYHLLKYYLCMYHHVPYRPTGMILLIGKHQFTVSSVDTKKNFVSEACKPGMMHGDQVFYPANLEQKPISSINSF